MTVAKGVGGAVAGAVSTGTRAFRRVDLDGDGIPDDARAFTALKDARISAAMRLKRKRRAQDAGESVDLEDESGEEPLTD